MLFIRPPEGKCGLSEVQTQTVCTFSWQQLSEWAPADYVSPHIYCFWTGCNGFMISLPVYLRSDKTQEQSNKSSAMKNSDNKLNKEKQMSRLDHRQETSRREKGGREAMRDKKRRVICRGCKEKKKMKERRTVRREKGLKSQLKIKIHPAFESLWKSIMLQKAFI